MKVDNNCIICEGKEIFQYNIQNDNGMSISIITLGAIIRSIKLPNCHGVLEDVVVSWKDIKDYINDSACTGAVVGRTAGRIADGQVTIKGKVYKFPQNQGVNTLHGGPNGLNTKIWEGKSFQNENEAGVILNTKCIDGENGYPGNVDISVKYSLNNENELKISYEAYTDKDTLINLTNHSYFNLSGNFKRNILDEKLMVDSDKFAQIREDSAPTGEILSVKNTPFDFTQVKTIGKDIRNDDEQLIRGNGYDHPWILNGGDGCKVRLQDEESGRSMEVYTDRESVVIYSTNYPEADKELLSGGYLKKNDAICFEAQSIPIGEKDSFLKSSYLEKDKKYKATTMFKFFF